MSPLKRGATKQPLISICMLNRCTSFVSWKCSVNIWTWHRSFWPHFMGFPWGAVILGGIAAAGLAVVGVALSFEEENVRNSNHSNSNDSNARGNQTPRPRSRSRPSRRRRRRTRPPAVLPQSWLLMEDTRHRAPRAPQHWRPTLLHSGQHGPAWLVDVSWFITEKRSLRNHCSGKQISDFELKTAMQVLTLSGILYAGSRISVASPQNLDDD